MESSLTHKEKKALLDARDDLLNYPLLGSLTLFAVICKQLVFYHRETSLSHSSIHIYQVCEGVDNQQFNAALHLMQGCLKLSSSEDGHRVSHFTLSYNKP